MTSPEPIICSLAWWEQLAPLLEVAGVFSASLVALYGLSTWKKEMKGKRMAELAEQVLVSFYEARDVFRWVRTQGFVFNEGESRPPMQNEDVEVSRRRNNYFIPIERLTREKALFAKLQAQRYTFEAFFGFEQSIPFGILAKAHNDILGAAGELIATAASVSNTPQKNHALKTIGRGSDASPDDMQHNIDSAISTMESFCRPILKGEEPGPAPVEPLALKAGPTPEPFKVNRD